jgi:DNA-binding CsgD family transcriptional regulator
MINNRKTTQKNRTAQVAGLMPSDSNIEFFGIRETQQVLWLQNGHTKEWNTLPKWIYAICKSQYLKDKKAVADLQIIETAVNRQVELYIYHLYGDIDARADFFNGELTTSENFRDSKDTPALKWDSKHITIGEAVLNERDILILDMILENLPDKAMASKMGIHQATFDFHKRNLYNRARVDNKGELIIKFFTNKIS